MLCCIVSTLRACSMLSPVAIKGQERTLSSCSGDLHPWSDIITNQLRHYDDGDHDDDDDDDVMMKLMMAVMTRMMVMIMLMMMATMMMTITSTITNNYHHS